MNALLLVAKLLMAASLLFTGCTTTVPGHGTTTISVSDDCRTGIDPGDPPWWPLCSDSD